MTIRDNEERLGAAQQHVDSPASSLPGNSAADPLNFVVPTMHVELPSRGQYYAENHPLHNEDSVEIRFMTAKDEDTLTSPTLIKKMIVLDRFVQNVLLDQRIRAEDLLLGDKNAILIESRISGYGQWYEVKVNCPSCGEEQTEEYDLEECKQTVHGDEEELEDVERLENGNYKLKLPKTGVECEIRLLRGHDEKIIVANMNKKGKRKNESYDNLTQQLKLLLVSVADYKDQKTIGYFVDNMPVLDARHLRAKYDKLNPNVELRGAFECQNCDHEEDVEVPLTVNFFWPKQ